MIQFDRKVFAETLRVIRERSPYNQTTLSLKLHMGRHAVGSYENGRSLPPIDTLIDICNILECDLNTLIFGLQHTGHTNNEKEMRLKHTSDMLEMCEKEKVLMKEFLNSLDRKNEELNTELEKAKSEIEALKTKNKSKK